MVNALDELRQRAGLSKAELARRIGKDPASVKRLFSVEVNHLPRILRPLVLRWTVNFTELASDRLKDTRPPSCALAIDPPDPAALKVVRENERSPRVGIPRFRTSMLSEAELFNE